MITSWFASGKGKEPSVQELIDRGFAPRGGVVDILFIFPPTTVSNRYGKKNLGKLGGDLPPLGMGSLAAFLREKGFGVGFLDCCALGLGYDAIQTIIKERNPHVIGFSSTTYALPSAINLVKHIQKDFPDKLTILGGAHSNVAPGQASQEYGCFDLEAFGADGEYTALEIMETYAQKNYDREAFLSDHDTLKNIQGIVFRQGDEVIKNLPRPDIQDLDVLPFPARDLFPMERYIPLPNQYKRLPLVNMVMIRGCPYRCTFCDQAGTGGRMRSPKRAVEEIQHVVEHYGIRELSFWDDTMSFNKKWMREFCERLIEANLGVIWSCYAAVKTINEPILKLMKQAGCWNIFYGFETGVPSLMKNIESDRKNGTPERIKQVARWTKEAGIEIRGSFMIGMPGETPELAEETIKFAIELDPEYAQFSITTPYPGTKLYNDIAAGKWGKFTTKDFSQFQMWNVVFLPEGYKNKEELWAMETMAFRRFYFRPKYILKRILAIRTLEDIKRYYKGGRALIRGFAFGPMPSHVREATGRNP